MQIQKLIKELKKFKNQKAKVLITIGDEDKDSLSTSEFEVFQDTSDEGYVELFVNEKTCSKQL
jgi:hypothetical protein